MDDHVEIARGYLAAYARGGLDAVAGYWHPEITWRAMEGAIDDVGVMCGPQAVRSYYRQWEELFDEVSLDAEELIEAGPRVVAVMHSTGRVKGSVAEIAIRYAIVLTIRDGSIWAGREYPNREEALRAASVTEPAGSGG